MPRTLNLSYLERLCKGNRARMAEYIQLYVQEAPGLFNNMNSQFAANDGVQLAKTAHSLHPHAHFMGEETMAALLVTIQETAKTEGALACSALVQECDLLHQGLMAALEPWLVKNG